MKTFYYCFFIVCLFGSCKDRINDESEYSSKAQLMIQKINIYNFLMGEKNFERSNEKHELIVWIRKNISDKDLIQLTDHPNKAVRTIAFFILARWTGNDLTPILRKHLYDDELIFTSNGCIGETCSVGDYFVKEMFVISRFHKVRVGEQDSICRMDSILIFSNSKLTMRNQSIEIVPAIEYIYPRIKEIAINEYNPFAVIKLAEYRKEEDIPFILSYRDTSLKSDWSYHTTYKAIKNFPHPDFFPFLKKRAINAINEPGAYSRFEYLMETIAEYNNKEAAELFQYILDTENDKYYKYLLADNVFHAIIDKKNKTFEPLFWQLWENYYRVTSGILKYLKNQDSNRAINLIKNSLNNYELLEERYSGQGINEWGEEDDLLVLMADMLWPYNKKVVLNFIQKYILDDKDFSIHRIKMFLKIGDDPSLIDKMIERLEKETNGNHFIPLVNLLLSYDNHSINSRILHARQINPNLTKGWAGDSLTNILIKQNLIMK